MVAAGGTARLRVWPVGAWARARGGALVFVFIGTIAAPGLSAESERKSPKRERSQAAAAPRGEPGSAWFRRPASWAVSVSRALAGPGAEAGGADSTRHATVRGQTPRPAVSPFPGSRDVRALLPCVLGTRSPWELASRGRGPRSGGPKTGGQLLCLMTFKGTSTPGKALASLDNRQHLGVPLGVPSWRSFARAILLRKPESKQVALPPPPSALLTLGSSSAQGPRGAGDGATRLGGQQLGPHGEWATCGLSAVAARSAQGWVCAGACSHSRTHQQVPSPPTSFDTARGSGGSRGSWLVPPGTVTRAGRSCSRGCEFRRVAALPRILGPAPGSPSAVGTGPVLSRQPPGPRHPCPTGSPACPEPSIQGWSEHRAGPRLSESSLPTGLAQGQASHGAGLIRTARAQCAG